MAAQKKTAWGLLFRTKMDFIKSLAPWFLSLAVLISSSSFSLAVNQDACAGVFSQSPEPHPGTSEVDGVKPTSYQAFKNRFSFFKKPLSAFEVRTRYGSFFHEIFADVDPVYLSRTQTRYKRLPFGEYGNTNFSTHHILINKKLKNHPLFPVIHAHELSHVYDLETALVSSQKRDLEEILDSEIRAHHRELVAALTIFTRDELRSLMHFENDPFIQERIEFILSHGHEPETYITVALLSKYRSLVDSVTKTKNSLHQALLIKRRVQSVLKNPLLKPENRPQCCVN